MSPHTVTASALPVLHSTVTAQPVVPDAVAETAVRIASTMFAFTLDAVTVTAQVSVRAAERVTDATRSFLGRR